MYTFCAALRQIQNQGNFNFLIFPFVFFEEKIKKICEGYCMLIARLNVSAIDMDNGQRQRQGC